LFAKYFQAHYQPRKFKDFDPAFEGPFASASFVPRTGASHKLVNCSKNRWSDHYYKKWFYLKMGFCKKVGEEEQVFYPIPSKMEELGWWFNPSSG
jgi:hypothetical protein